MNDGRLVWIDLEMTGLDPSRDFILEIATVITDNDLTVIAEGPSLIIHCDQLALDTMSQEVREMHTKSGLLDKVKHSSVTIEHAQQQTIAFIKQHAQIGVSPLCGNSIYCDRMFLRRFMPEILKLLHYRIIDVSSVKELVQRWYPGNSRADFQKKETHRALQDIKESIEELKHYRKYFFV